MEGSGNVRSGEEDVEGDTIALFKYLKGCHREEDKELFLLDIRKICFTVRGQQWNWLPKEVENCPPPFFLFDLHKYKQMDF